MAVIGLEQPFAGAVGAMLRFDDVRATDDKAFSKPRAHGLGDIGHRLEFDDAAVVEPMKHLLGAQLGLFLV